MLTLGGLRSQGSAEADGAAKFEQGFSSFHAKLRCAVSGGRNCTQRTIPLQREP